MYRDIIGLLLPTQTEGGLFASNMMGFHLNYGYGNFEELTVYPASSSRIYCAAVCSIEMDYDLCTAFKFDADSETCRCGKLRPLVWGPFVERRVHVGINCPNANMSGNVKIL